MRAGRRGFTRGCLRLVHVVRTELKVLLDESLLQLSHLSDDLRTFLRREILSFSLGTLGGILGFVHDVHRHGGRSIGLFVGLIEFTVELNRGESAVAVVGAFETHLHHVRDQFFAHLHFGDGVRG